MTKNPKCKNCGTEDKEEFYASNKVMCKVCLSEKNKKEKEEIQKILERASSPKVKTPRAMSPERENFELKNKISFLESELLLLKGGYQELLERINSLEKKEESKPVKCDLPLPLPVVITPKPKTPKVKVEKENNVLENLPSMTTQELRNLAKELGVPIPLNKRKKDDMIELISEKLSE
jgi:hypothetical protein